MATDNQKKRRELKEKRLAAEKQSKGEDRRQNVVKAVAAIAFLAIVGVVIAVVLNTSGGGSDETAKSDSEIEKLFTGLAQEGRFLGDPKAPVTLIEFADLQCPSCKDFAENALPQLIEDEVRTGRVRLDMLFLNTASPDYEAAKAALAASEQGRFWQFTEYFYANQGVSGTGYVTDDFLRDIASKAGVPDLDKWEEDRSLPKWDKLLVKDEDTAFEAGATGTPTFAIRNPDGSLETIPGSSVEDLKKAIQQAR